MTHNARYLIGAILLGIFAAGQVAAMPAQEAENRLRKKILSKWQCRNLEFRVLPFSDPAQARNGRYQVMVLRADSVVISDVALRNVEVKAYDVVLDLSALVRQDHFATKSQKRTTFFARVSEADLNRALTRKKTPVENLRVALGNGTVVFTGRYKMVMGHNLRLEGRLEIANGTQINLVPTRASVNGVPLPTGPLRTVLSSLNPLVDTRDVPMTPRLRNITVRNNEITIEG